LAPVVGGALAVVGIEGVAVAAVATGAAGGVLARLVEGAVSGIVLGTGRTDLGPAGILPAGTAGFVIGGAGVAAALETSGIGLPVFNALAGLSSSR